MPWIVLDLRLHVLWPVGILSSFTSNPNLMLWNVASRALYYVKKIMHYGLKFVGYPPVL